MKPILLAGTDGYSIWFSDNLGESFTRLLSDSGLYSESRIYAMTSDPADPGRVLIGTDSGLYQFEVAKSRFNRVESLMNGLNVWSIAFASSDPSLVLAGTRKPAGVFRSTDGGRKLGYVTPLICQATSICDLFIRCVVIQTSCSWEEVTGHPEPSAICCVVWMPAQAGLVLIYQ